MSKQLFSEGDVAEVDDVISPFHGKRVRVIEVAYNSILDTYQYFYLFQSMRYVMMKPECFKKVEEE